MVSRPRWRSALIGADNEVFLAGTGVFSTSTTVAMRAIAISTETP